MDKMGTVTLNLDDDIEQSFRDTTKKTYGVGKGRLKQAAQDAISQWISKVNQESAKREVIAFLEKGLPIGYKPYRSRDELHRY